ncbi:MAG: beta-propeller fold lactonase family protein [Prevotellaceae bacterium]|jgi:YVTN family beta-propeller protein|nr:beta-propeller fold lactonase family protein [Prevotellaceae bacterium]
MKRLTYLLLLVFNCSFAQEVKYLSPGAVAIDKKQSLIYTALTTAKSIAVTDIASGQTGGQIKLKQNPNSILLSSDASTLYASTGEAAGTVNVIDLLKGKVKSTIATGHTPEGMALSADGKTLYVANRFSNTVSVIDLVKNKLIKSIPMIREPRYLSITPDGKTLAVANFLPAQASTATVVASQITLVDAATNTVSASVTLPNGSQSLTGIACSPDGNCLYAVHLLSRFSVPITQLDRGWVNTNALSIIDLKSKSLYATVLLDDVDHGAANPYGICIDDKGKLFVAVSGSHELMSIDLEGLQNGIAALFTGKKQDAYVRNREDLSSSLSFVSPYKKRIVLKGRSPRELACAGGKIYVSSRFSPFIEAVPAEGGSHEILSLGEEAEPDGIRRGELAFCDASICYQQWQSCASCHPDGRADGLNWDQQNDGLGNPKNTKSLLYSHVTPPCMITGIRESAELAVRNGILHTLQTKQPEALSVDIDDYLKNLAPLESPFMKEYRKSKSKQLGKKLFEQAGCTQCHNGNYLTDMTKYDVGSGDGNDAGRAFDTPSLSEIWRTAPYLYDGRAASLQDMFTIYNSDDKHGFTKKLSKEELDALILYINTL